MALTLPFAEATSVGSPALNIAIFASFVANPSAAIPATSASRSTLACLSASSLKQPPSSFSSNDACLCSSRMVVGQRPGSVWRHRWSGLCFSSVGLP